MTFGERVTEAVEEWLAAEPGRSKIELVRQIGISEPTLFNWLKGETTPEMSPKFLKLCQIVKRSPTWLLFQKGPKSLDDESALGKLVDEISDFSDDEFDALRAQANLLKRARQPRK